MNEQKILTMDEAKGRMEHIRRVAIEYNDLPRINCAGDCLNILARVEQPSEDDRAVLWLIRERGWVVYFNRQGGSGAENWTKNLGRGTYSTPPKRPGSWGGEGE